MLPRPLSPLAPLPNTPSLRESFQPTASRTRGAKSKTIRQNQTQIPRARRSPLEETMDPDISIWQKTGHFYFALTPMEPLGVLIWLVMVEIEDVPVQILYGELS